VNVRDKSFLSSQALPGRGVIGLAGLSSEASLVRFPATAVLLSFAVSNRGQKKSPTGYLPGDRSPRGVFHTLHSCAIAVEANRKPVHLRTVPE
jgi:hypothetical protein